MSNILYDTNRARGVNSMTSHEFLSRMKVIEEMDDIEAGHSNADDLLVTFIRERLLDHWIEDALGRYAKLPKWCA